VTLRSRYSLKDLAGTLCGFYGALLTSRLGVEVSDRTCGEIDFENMWKLCVARGVSRLLPIVFIHLLPTVSAITRAD
jgi:hypothetical protein